MTSEHDYPRNQEPRSAESVRIGAIPPDLLDAAQQLGPEIGVSVEPLTEENDRTGFMEKLKNARKYVDLRGFMTRGDRRDVEAFTEIVGKAVTHTKDEVQKHPKLTTVAAVAVFSIAAYKMIEKRKQGKLHRTGLSDRSMIE